MTAVTAILRLKLGNTVQSSPYRPTDLGDGRTWRLSDEPRPLAGGVPRSKRNP
ncbi:hypothetical protein ACFP1C_01040 [Levilactobacillus fujinensis]|uniref:Uncharacterized protein n=1 Tax=Levilactobacillus fujinensis TaxID=2486024 RepID=A0ABW1TCA8_9LACO